MIIGTKKAIFTGLAVVAIGAFAVEMTSEAKGARAVGDVHAPVAESIDHRIGSAFELAGIAPAAAKTAAAKKGDRLPARCLGQAWPAIGAECLSRAGMDAAEPVRTVTVEYRTGPATSVLMRMPAGELASR